LPTKVNLCRWKVVEDDFCPCCTREVESVIHALWCCPAAQDVWGRGSIVFQKCKTKGGSFKQLMDECLNRPSKEDVELMAVICRHIWLRRNKMVFDQIFTPPSVVYGDMQPQFLLFVGKLHLVVRLKVIGMHLSIRAWISLGLEW